jgi:hypothetical protein
MTRQFEDNQQSIDTGADAGAGADGEAVRE